MSPLLAGSLADKLKREWTRMGLVATLLWPVHALMWVLVALRRFAFCLGVFKTHTLPVPVVVVGNRVVGGAGKTPTVMALIEHLRAQGWSPGVLSRGYGREHAQAPSPLLLDTSTAHLHNARTVGDEPWLIWRRTRTPMCVGHQRVQAARTLLSSHGNIDILISDDGLQHLSMARQVEVVVFDERGAGNGLLLPAGPLREPINSPSGPHCRGPAIVLYNADTETTPAKGHTASRQLLPPMPLQLWWGDAPKRPGHVMPDWTSLLSVPASQCMALAGIAQPARFFAGLRSLGLQFSECALADHAPLLDLPWPLGWPHVIMTEKDAVKLSPERVMQERPGTQVWVAALAFHPADTFWRELDTQLAPWRAKRTGHAGH